MSALDLLMMKASTGKERVLARGGNSTVSTIVATVIDMVLNLLEYFLSVLIHQASPCLAPCRSGRGCVLPRVDCEEARNTMHPPSEGAGESRKGEVR